ncbi:MAG TPA: molybdenum cofactor biosynthesis protein MoaE [Gemmatimonadaceae bacterium]|nr:molybdenum cofactor biosynthesis protein MoaE [Gemmatimonadaceae bacterium]
MIRVALVMHPIDVSALIAEVADVSTGATAVFVGTVRDVNDDKAVSGIDYSAYTVMAEREMLRIAQEAARQFAPLRVVVEHRVGALELGDVSVTIATAHAHRAPAIDGMRFVIEEIKRRVPIWKQERYLDGTREWVGV